MKLDLVLQVYAVLLRNVVQPGENRQENMNDRENLRKRIIRQISTLNPLRFNSDLSQTSHCNIKDLPVSEVVRILLIC